MAEQGCNYVCTNCKVVLVIWPHDKGKCDKCKKEEKKLPKIPKKILTVKRKDNRVRAEVCKSAISLLLSIFKVKFMCKAWVSEQIHCSVCNHMFSLNGGKMNIY